MNLFNKKVLAEVDFKRSRYDTNIVLFDDGSFLKIITYLVGNELIPVEVSGEYDKVRFDYLKIKQDIEHFKAGRYTE